MWPAWRAVSSIMCMMIHSSVTGPYTGCSTSRASVERRGGRRSARPAARTDPRSPRPPHSMVASCRDRERLVDVRRIVRSAEEVVAEPDPLVPAEVLDRAEQTSDRSGVGTRVASSRERPTSLWTATPRYQSRKPASIVRRSAVPLEVGHDPVRCLRSHSVALSTAEADMARPIR